MPTLPYTLGRRRGCHTPLEGRLAGLGIMFTQLTIILVHPNTVLVPQPRHQHRSRHRHRNRQSQHYSLGITILFLH